MFREDGVKIMRLRGKDLLVIVPERGGKTHLGKWVLTDRYLVGEIDRDDMMIAVRDRWIHC